MASKHKDARIAVCFGSVSGASRYDRSWPRLRARHTSDLMANKICIPIGIQREIGSEPVELGDVPCDQVLLLGDGDAISVGTPTVPGASVSATIKSHGRGDKIRIVKFRRRKHHRKQMGHRQHFTEVEITGIHK